MKLLTLATLATAAAALEFDAFSYNAKQVKTGACPTVDTVRNDLKVLEKYTNEVRIYSVNDCHQGEPVLRAMEGTDWKVQLGLWVGKDDAVFEKDKTELLRLAGIFDFKKQVSSVIVGNEAIYRKEQTSAQVAKKIADVKQALAKAGLKDIPVTCSETWPGYDATLIDAVDYINMHAFPFWEGINIDGAQAKMFEHIYNMQKISKGKPVVVGETGWPSAGGQYGNAVPSLDNEHRYLKEFICRATQEKIKYVWFSAFDEAWKPTTNASDVETHWGVIDGNYKPKFSYPMYDCTGFKPSGPKPPSGDNGNSNGNGQADDSSNGNTDITGPTDFVLETYSESSTDTSTDTGSGAAGITVGGSIFVAAVAVAASSFF